MVCLKCGEAVLDGVKYCSNCGSKIETHHHDKVVDTDDNAKQIRQVLKSYKKYTTATCLECGYEGMMGIKKDIHPWYSKWWVLLPLILTGVGVIPALILAFVGGWSVNHEVECPSCRKVLITR